MLRNVTGLIYVLRDSLEDALLRLRADDLFNRLAILVEDHRRDRDDAKLAGDTLIFVDVDLRNLERARLLLGDLVQDRTDDAARATPRRPEVDEHRGIGIDDFILEGRVADGNWLTH